MEMLHGGLYQVLRELGRGANGRVLLVKDTNIGKYWAIKEMPKDKDENILGEAKVLLSLNHPGIVRIVSLFEENDNLYMVMDYIKGNNLKEIQKHAGNFSENVVRKWGIELCDILSYMHKNNPPIIYRDLKPSNIMLQENGHLILVDFGTAGTGQTGRDHMGSKGFASPEQYDILQKTDEKSDVYALGCCMYYLLTGRTANTESASDRKNGNIKDKKIHANDFCGISSKMAAIIRKCIQKEPKDRYQNMDAVADVLKSYPLKQSKENKRKIRRKRCFGISVIACVFILSFSIRMYLHEKQNRDEKYAAYLAKANLEPRDDKKSKLLEQAIELYPQRLEAYAAYLNFVRDDGIFSVSEEQMLREYIDASEDSLSGQKDYPAFAMEIGECYLYDQASDDFPAEEILEDAYRYKESLRWLQRAYAAAADLPVEKQSLLAEYKGLAEFLADSDNTTGRYARCYYHLNKLCLQNYGPADESFIQKQSIGELTNEILDTYRSEMICDGITDSEIRILKEKVQMMFEK